jgi:NAD(P)-dependent dehydrogenase (short-subunit alcohol dehydrogenase family)
MGGRHGDDERGALCPLGGAVSGFTKTLQRERPSATVKVVDFTAEEGASSLATKLLDETLLDPGIVEVGYAEGLRWNVSLQEQSLGAVEEEFELPDESVFVVTGAAGSIVSAIVEDLSRRWPGHYYLLDLTPAPDPENPDVALLVSDREGLKRELFERLKQSGEKATPANVERQLAALERTQAALAALRAVGESGGEGHYRSVDLLNAQAVAEVMSEIQERHGRIDVLVHAAGVEISHMLPNKSRQEFDLIFDVKADGWFHLMKSAAAMPIGSTVVFTSIAGRFGNAGQTDYSAANDLLCKLTTNLRSSRPETRGIAIDWSAWADIGMASRGSIPKMMEQAGIDMVPPSIGIPIVGREIAQSTGDEIVVAGSLGDLLADRHETGGLSAPALGDRLSGPMAKRVKGLGLYSGLVVEVELDPSRQPFLFDHRIDVSGPLQVLPG